MTEIILNISDNIYITVSGHCKDSTLCSCISTLVGALEGYLANSNVKYSYTEKDGYCSFIIPKGEQNAADMFIIGVLRLEKMFPKLIRINNV